MTEAFVEVRARSRFMIYGQSPARDWNQEVWTLRIPATWVEGVPPGASSPELTKRCQQAVLKENEKWRAEAIAMAERSEAAGGDYDAGHSIVQPTSVRLYFAWELQRRPWTKRFFYVVDEAGGMRAGTEADVPALPDLTPFQESAFAGWREEQVERWRGAAAAYSEALRRAGPDSEPALVSEVESSLVRVNEAIQRIDKAASDARERAAADAAATAAAAARWGAVDYKAPGPRKSSDGQSLMKQSSYPEAIESLRAALDEELPANTLVSRVETLFHLGIALEHENRLDEAQARLRSALAERIHEGAHPVSDAVLMEISLARVLARSGPGHAAEARTLLERAAPRLWAGAAVSAHHRWASALLDHAAGDTARALLAMDRAEPRLRYFAIYGPWLKRDRAQMARATE